MASTQVIRVTMFKFPKKEDREAMVENYRELMKTAVKVCQIFYLFGSCQNFIWLRVVSFDSPCVILTSYPTAQDGKPYVLSIEAGPTSDDSNLNFNFVGKSVFKNLEDMMYYDKECVAHKKLKANVAKELDLQGIMTVYYTPAFSASL
jgi:hypothetical protein